MPEQRLPEPDVLRAVGIVAVVIIHSSAIAQGALTPASRLYPVYFGLTRLVLFGVPLFVFVSGLVLGHRYSVGPFSGRTFYRRRLATVVVPYAAWTAIYWLYSTLAAAGPDGLPAALATLATRAWWAGLARVFFLGTAYYHLYFVVIIVQFYLLFPLLLAMGRALAGRPLVALLGAALIHLAYALGARRLGWAFSDRFFLTYFVFFSAGLLAGLRLPAFRRFASGHEKSLAAAFWATAGLYVGFTLLVLLRPAGSPWARLATSGAAGLTSVLIWTLYSLTAGAYFLALASGRWHGWRGQRWLPPLFIALGRESFGIYLIHPLVLDGLERLAAAVGPVSTTLRFGLEVAGALGLSSLTSGLLRRFPVTSRLVGR
jgi:surface polysaccharide O-acyltransferase-like enzyme